METIERTVHTIDATGQSLGRLASEIATLLRGKHKPSFMPHIDGGDIVKVVNVGEMKLTGKKMVQKEYHRATGYPGNLKTTSMKKLFEENPEQLLRQSVRGMLPDNKLRPQQLKRLNIS